MVEPSLGIADIGGGERHHCNVQLVAGACKCIPMPIQSRDGDALRQAGGPARRSWNGSVPGTRTAPDVELARRDIHSTLQTEFVGRYLGRGSRVGAE